MSAVFDCSGKVTCIEAFVIFSSVLFNMSEIFIIATCEGKRKESQRKEEQLKLSEKVSFQHSSTVVGRRVSKPPCLVPSAGRSPRWGSSMP